MSTEHAVQSIEWEWAPDHTPVDNKIYRPDTWGGEIAISFEMPPSEAEFTISSAYLAQAGVVGAGQFIRIRDAGNLLANGTWRITRLKPQSDLFTEVKAVKVKDGGGDE